MERDIVNDNTNNNNSKGSNLLLECIICMNSPAEDPVVTQCGHIFCWPCLKGWVENSKKMFCPTCKNGIELSKVIPLYANSTNKYSDKPRQERIEPQNNPNRPGFLSSLYQSFVYSTEVNQNNNRPLNAKEVQANQLALLFFVLIIVIILLVLYS